MGQQFDLQTGKQLNQHEMDEIRHFPNGNVGKWNGSGWVDVTPHVGPAEQGTAQPPRPIPHISASQPGQTIFSGTAVPPGAKPPAEPSGTFLGLRGPGGKKGPGINLPAQSGEDAKNMISSLLQGLGLSAAVMQPEFGIPFSTAMGAGTGALNGSLTNPEGGAAGAWSGGLENLLLGASHLTQGAIPHVTNRAAYRLGGMGKEDASDATDLLNTLNKGRGGPLNPFNRRFPVGAKGRIDTLVHDTGDELDATRQLDRSGPIGGKHDFTSTLRGFSDQPFDESLNVRLPHEEGLNIRQGEADTIESQLKRRGTPVDFSGNKTRPGKPVNMGGDPTTFMGMEASPRYMLPTSVPDQPPPPRSILHTLEPQSTAQMRELETSLKHSNPAENLRKAQKSGDQVSASDYKQGRTDQSIARQIQDKMYEAEDSHQPGGIGPGPMKQADRAFNLAKDVQTNNVRIRSTHPFGEAGKMAARGGLGFGIGSSLGGLVGGYPGAAVGGGIGAPLAMYGLSPYGMSQAGYLADDAVRSLQALGLSYKLARELVDANKTDRENNVKLRSIQP